MSSGPPPLSRRERQIMDVLFARGRATAAEIGAAIPDAPSNSALRTLLRVLEEKGHAQHEEIGRAYFYSPTVRLETARRSALQHLVDTFFAGSMEDVVSTMLKLRRNGIEPEEAARLRRMIEDAARKGR
ncbi:MAG TPA: BlaI/MecI/CopY family transcriptional regulator [Candidatus Udaeobacter sp.]|nr:BlaI/MecI/CopY family transcriptional regulator [Candidatus Udaeobacter sp.]